MDSMQLFVAATYIICGIFLAPFYVRIIYIFCVRKQFRCMECYQIMIQIGIAQCLIAPGTFFVGLANLLNEDYFRLAASTLKIVSAAIRLESVLSLVLALNRLKIICRLRYPDMIHTVLLALSWTFGFLYVGFFFSPWCDYIVVPGQYISKYDLSKPYSGLLKDIGSYVLISATTLSLIVYATIILYLGWTHWKVGKTVSISKEKPILYYAGVRFLFDMTLTVTYNFVRMPSSPWLGFFNYMTYVFNNLVLPPILYLCLYRYVYN
ncbi:hypothetical protein L596_026878 [Steinernema carpocapsae]|nr:hypothetical protein L596_026878 [Steinernema carpocapsae]